MTTEEDSPRSHQDQRLTKGERLYLREEIERLHSRGRSFVSYPFALYGLRSPLPRRVQEIRRRWRS